MRRNLREPVLRFRDGEFEAKCFDCFDKKQACYWPVTTEFWDPRNLQRCRACFRERRRGYDRTQNVSARKRQYQAAYRAEAADILRRQARDYYKANRDAVRARQRGYDEAHRAEIAARRREHYIANRDRLREDARARYWRRRDEIVAQKREQYALGRAA